MFFMFHYNYFMFHYNYRASMWHFFRPMWSTLNPHVVRFRLMARFCSLPLMVMTTNFFPTVLYRILGKVTIWPTFGSKCLIGKYRNDIIAICVMSFFIDWFLKLFIYMYVRCCDLYHWLFFCIRNDCNAIIIKQTAMLTGFIFACFTIFKSRALSC